MLTWARPRLARKTPSARTAGSPPPDSRTLRATARATDTSGVSSTALKAMRKNRAPITVDPRRAEVRSLLRVGEPGRETLEAAAPDVGQQAPAGLPGRTLVEEDRQAEAVRHLGGQVLRRGHGRLHGRIPQGDERHHVHGPDPGMDAFVVGQVDFGQRGCVEREETGAEVPGLAREGQDGTVVVGIGMEVEQPDARRRGDRSGQPGHHLGAAAFAHVGDAFQRRHGGKSITSREG